MSDDNTNLVYILFLDEFENELYRLSKRYRNIRADVEPIIAEIKQHWIT